MRSDRVCNRKIGIARLTPGDSCIPTRVLMRPSRPYGKRSSSRSFRRAAAASRTAADTPPVTPAWRQSPEHLRRSGDCRFYCYAPASLWPSEPSTDSLDLTHNRYDAKFKTKVALEAIKGRETLNELAVKYEVSPIMISRWKKEFIENSAAAFETL